MKKHPMNEMWDDLIRALLIFGSLGCIVFVLIGLGAFALVVTLMRRRDRLREARKVIDDGDGEHPRRPNHVTDLGDDDSLARQTPPPFPDRDR